METASLKKRIAALFLLLFIVLFFVCLYYNNLSKTDLIHAKGDVARAEAEAYRNWIRDPDVDTSELDSVVLKRNLYTCGMVISVISSVVCIIILASKEDDSEKSSDSIHTHNNIPDKLQQLKSMLDSNIITEQEYESKKQELLNKF